MARKKIAADRQDPHRFSIQLYVPFIKRNRYFSGKLLSEKDLTDEQNYYREKLRLHNIKLHGWGIVSGLQASVSNNGIIISAGMAIDGYGRELVLIGCITIALPKERCPWWIVLKYAERQTDAVPVPSTGTENFQSSRVEEGVEIFYAADDPQIGSNTQRSVPDSIAIAKVQWKRDGWRLVRRVPRPNVRLR